MSYFNINKAKEIINNAENIIIFDIGAHNFEDSKILKSAFPNSVVYAFEPDIKNIQYYSSSAEQCGVKVINLALSDSTGETTFYNSETLNGREWLSSGSILKPITIENTNEGLNHKGLLYNLTGYKIQTTTFKDFCDTQNITPTIVHMDVQGAETKIMKGIGNYRPKIIFTETCEFDTYETGTDIQQFDSIMKDLGYKIWERLQYDTFYVYSR
jgi:FkbM family methyltransferase